MGSTSPYRKSFVIPTRNLSYRIRPCSIWQHKPLFGVQHGQPTTPPSHGDRYPSRAPSTAVTLRHSRFFISVVRTCEIYPASRIRPEPAAPSPQRTRPCPCRRPPPPPRKQCWQGSGPPVASRQALFSPEHGRVSGTKEGRLCSGLKGPEKRQGRETRTLVLPLLSHLRYCSFRLCRSALLEVQTYLDFLAHIFRGIKCSERERTTISNGDNLPSLPTYQPALRREIVQL